LIGVIIHEDERDAAREFFELFKTPWEHYQPGHRYGLVITTQDQMPVEGSAEAVAIYSSQPVAADRKIGTTIRSVCKGGWVEWEQARFPVYGNVAVLECKGQLLARLSGTDDAIAAVHAQPGPQVMRMGFDLFQEAQFLFSEGQPAIHAQVPTLEFHIALLRDILLRAGIAFVEVPPAPAGYEFMGCLTHDVDFRGICDHKLDWTMWGFVYRGVIGSLSRAAKKRMEWSKCWTNLKAVLSLPFVYSGLKPDFWLEFDRYAALEQGLGSTFYFVPFRNYAGGRAQRPAPKRRAVKYDLSAVAEEVRHLQKSGCEVGVHGIDAWQDAGKGLIERRRIDEITGQTETGVRMHWLYFDAGSPKALKQAGFAYDSTFGYNDAIGFRAGTSQVFRPRGPESVLELPLNIQDTALFYPDRMDLSEPEALRHCERLIDAMCRFGGVLTINWHTRSLSPERLWDNFYGKLLNAIRQRLVWFATANTIVKWFGHRRSLSFDCVQYGAGDVTVRMSGPVDPLLPSFALRIYHPALQVKKAGLSAGNPVFADEPWSGEEQLTISLQG
jgi:hypothetical protein